jgi:hypothetical protein
MPIITFFVQTIRVTLIDIGHRGTRRVFAVRWILAQTQSQGVLQNARLVGWCCPWRLFFVGQDTRREKNRFARLVCWSFVVLFSFVFTRIGNLRDEPFTLRLKTSLHRSFDQEIHSRIFVCQQTNGMFDNDGLTDGHSIHSRRDDHRSRREEKEDLHQTLKKHFHRRRRRSTFTQRDKSLEMTRTRLTDRD